MNYYRCEECGQRYCGWANNNNNTCEKCNGQLKEISRGEFELIEEDRKGVKEGVSSKDIY